MWRDQLCYGCKENGWNWRKEREELNPTEGRSVLLFDSRYQRSQPLPLLREYVAIRKLDLRICTEKSSRLCTGQTTMNGRAQRNEWKSGKKNRRTR